MKQIKKVENGYMYQVSTHDGLSFPLLHLYGSPYEMGYAQGQLLGIELLQFIVVLKVTSKRNHVYAL